jgi:regulator of sirC expression with transglutaminase-like and TPR domain
MSLMENSPFRVFSEIVQQPEDRIDLGYAALVMAQPLEDLEAYLRLAPEAEDADAIREQVVTLRSRVPQIH